MTLNTTNYKQKPTIILSWDTRISGLRLLFGPAINRDL